MQPLIQSWRSYLRSGRPTWFAGLYIAFSWVWIFLTDKLIEHFSFTMATAMRWGTVKDCFYIAITSGLIYAILRRLNETNNNLETTVASRTAALAASEEESRSREEWLRRLVASLPDVSWTSAEDGRTIFMSSNVESIFGYSPEELCNYGEAMWVQTIHPDDLQRVGESYRALFSRGERFDVEFRARCKDGHFIWVHDRAFRTHTENGVRFADGILSDITARKQAELARSESEQRYRLLFERNLAGVFRAEVGGKMLDCNPALVRMLGYHSADELLGRPSAEILYDSTEQTTLLENLAMSGAISNVEIRLRRKDGALLWGLHNVSLLASDNGRAPCIEGMVVDVTERKQTVSALSQQLSLMQAITSTAPNGLLLLDADGRLTFINPAGERMFGYTAAELHGKVMHDVCHYKHTDGSPFPRSECPIAQAGASGKTLQGHEDVHFRKDGSPVDISFSSAPVMEGDRVVGSVLVAQDITQRKLAEQKYELLQEQFLHAQKMEAIGCLAGGIAHDFNNLLQVINGYSSLIVDECGPNPELAKRAWAIHEAGTRAALLTQQLLDFSRKEQGHTQTISLGSAVNKLMKMVRTLVGEDIDLTAANRTDGACAKINPGQLEQVVMNLVVNARDAMPNGGKLHIETSCVTLEEYSAMAFGNLPAGAYVQLSVSDTGCGMDADTMNRAFEPFFTTKEPGKGTGLGLSTVYGIATQNGGGIRTDSALGAGTTFHVCLPVAESAPVRPVIQLRLALPQGTESILLAEDEAGVRSLISGQLGRLGYKVTEAGNGAEALQLAKDSPRSIDLLVSDVMMPTMGGKELAERIREICPAIKIVQMSGYHDMPQSPAYDGANSIQHLHKPFDLETLAATVRHALDQ
jgi:two-component system, cell cycle sensor histidine kinase and response regulator CckA